MQKILFVQHKKYLVARGEKGRIRAFNIKALKSHVDEIPVF
jgi:hypothetical protein